MNKFLISRRLFGEVIKANIRSVSTTTKLDSNIYNIQDYADFEKRVLKNTKPVIVDFHATWCGPCKILGPRLEKIMAKYDGKVDMAKVDVDDVPDAAMKYNIGSIPTVISLKNGVEVGKFVGLKENDLLVKFVQQVLEK